ncbi:MAG: aminomethyltransferase family protein [Akkermansia sp.]|nr:aminomethyltransferase family protein [Akkermansia sp.]
MNESPINPLHRKRGAQMGAEHGWYMPQQFTNLAEEHRASRAACGLFDISHLSKIRVVGNGALAWLEGLLSNRISRCLDGFGQHTLLLRDDGSIIDRLILFRESAGRFFLLGHASMEQTVLDWLHRHRPDGPLEVQNLTRKRSGIALSGPDSIRILRRVLQSRELPPPMGILRTMLMGEELILTHAGIAGRPGYELFCPAASGIRFYEDFFRAGATPCGSSTRETLRLEQASPDTAHDLRHANTPVRAGLECYCDLTKNYPGSETLHAQRMEGTPKMLAALECETKEATPRRGDSVTDEDGHTVGSITSGAFSPGLGHSVALAYLLNRLCRPGTHLRIRMRGQSVPAIVRTPPDAEQKPYDEK